MAGADRPRVGLVLGAGGVVGGAFHAGVLAALEEGIGWDPRQATVVVGTSAGSVAATTLRAGLAGRDMFARAVGAPLSAAGARLMASAGSPLRSPPLTEAPRTRRPGDVAAALARAAARPLSARPVAVLAGLLPEGTVGTELISGAIGAIAPPGGWPEDLWVCAVRQRDGRLVVFGRDARPPLGDAVAASCAIPGYYRPVVIDGEPYIDGGAHSPTNADVLTQLRLDLVVVSSPMSVTGRGAVLGLDQPVRRWSRLLLDTEALRLRRRGTPVVAFQPTAADLQVMGVNAMDPRRRASVASQIRESTLRRLERPDARRRLAVIAG